MLKDRVLLEREQPRFLIPRKERRAVVERVEGVEKIRFFDFFDDAKTLSPQHHTSHSSCQ